MPSDPLAQLYDDLERGGYDPRGPEYKFRSRCPGHDGEAHSLAVCEGVDGRAVLFCHAHQCEPADIMTALGRGVRDLFRDDTPRDNRAPEREDDLAAALLMRLYAIGIGWKPGLQRDGTPNPGFFVGDRCPVCKSPHLLIQRVSQKTAIVSCAAGCSQRSIRAALRVEAVVR